MKHRNMIWAGHVFLLILLADGVRWILENMRALSDYRLLLVMAAMTGLVLNHCRWWILGNRIEDKQFLDKIDPLILANYCIMVLVLQLFHLYS